MVSRKPKIYCNSFTVSQMKITLMKVGQHELFTIQYLKQLLEFYPHSAQEGSE
jgi:hypothetical protein